MANEELQRSYYAIIPANVRYDKDLTPNAKLLYGEITALCNERGYCWATNAYFSNLYGVSNTSISKWVNSLVQKGYISSEIIYKEGTKQIESRYLRIVNEPIKEKLNTPIEENLNSPIEDKFKDNNTKIFNNKNNNNTSNKGIYIRTADNDYLGTYKNIKLKENELAKLYEEYGERLTEDAIEHLSEYIELKGYKAKSHYLAMRKWVFTAVKEERIKKQELEQREKRAQEIAKKNSLHELKAFYSKEYTPDELNAMVDDIDDVQF
jgi:uncharacterized membrane protein YheB (UPF0754 family)